MRSFFEKSKTINSVYAQMLVIVIAFVIMGVSSFIFATNIEYKHLVKDAENAIAFTESEIISSLLEHETYLISFAETIRSMVIGGETEAALSAYITSITEFTLKDEDRMTGFIGLYGYINGLYISGLNTSISEETIQNEPWFKLAVEAEGKIAVTDPYITDVFTGQVLLTFSRYITDYEGNALGVICLDVDLNKISNYAITINLTEGSYGLLLNKNLDIIAHPASYYIGVNLRNTISGISNFANELEMGKNITERRVKNYMFHDTIAYFQKIKYDWFLGVIIPVKEYYRSVNNMAAFLILIGTILASALCTMLYYISQAKTKSDKKTQQKSNFLATMSHEIRTPLNAIMGMTEIQMQNTSHPIATSEAFLKINNSGNLLLNIINDILDLSKIEAGKLELIPEKYETASLINDIIQLNYIRYESKPIEFIIDIDENIPSVLVGDELRIKQILNNLLSNAFKYTEKGQVTLTVNAECIGRGGGAVIVTLVFQIKDTGHGMTPEQVSKLFDEYTRFNLEANRITEGAGLGMTITRNLVDLMYGKINVKSAVGEGTIVTVRLPQKTDGIGIRGMIGKELAENLKHFKLGNVIKLKKAKISHEYMPYGRVLIVDDVETNLYVAKGLMAPYGLKIDLAVSGFEAVDKIKNGEKYDIIFMDHMMPKMDGIETTKLLREIGYTLPVVALTANAIAGQAEMFLKNSFNDYVSKPIDIRQLNIVLNKFIRDKQTAEVIEAAKKEKAKMDKKHEAGLSNQQVDPQLALIFTRDAEKARNVIKACLDKDFSGKDDIHTFIINIHAMKSALANIGELELSSAANRLEQAGREKDINVIFSETGKFLEDLNKIINNVKPQDDENEITEDSEESLAFLKEKLTIIIEACTTFDKKIAKNALSTLREKSWSHEVKDLINLIAEHLLHSEFDDAASLAERYKEKK